MPFQEFHDLFPGLAESETRTIIVLPGCGDTTLPEGQYALSEMYCNERGCDCRRVFFYVRSSFRVGPEAVIAWGWESRDFYARWLPEATEAMVDELQGPVLNLGSPATELALPLLEKVATILSADAEYVARIKEHYRLFRRRIDRKRIDRGRAPAWFETGAAGEGPSRRRPPRRKTRRR